MFPPPAQRMARLRGGGRQVSLLRLNCRKGDYISKDCKRENGAVKPRGGNLHTSPGGAIFRRIWCGRVVG